MLREWELCCEQTESSGTCFESSYCNWTFSHDVISIDVKIMVLKIKNWLKNATCEYTFRIFKKKKKKKVNLK